MMYNHRTEQAQCIEKVAEQARAVIEKLEPIAKPNDIVWSSLEGRWIKA